MLSLVLLEPESAGNLGFIARAMKNFDFKDLRLVNPRCEIGKKAFSRAMHAEDVLEQAREFYDLKQASKDLDFLVGTTGVKTSDKNLSRTGITPKKLAQSLPKDAQTGLLLGRESKGLSNKEIDQCDFIVQIPTSDNYPIMNLSHAATIILYEIYQGRNQRERKDKARENGLAEEKRVMEKLFKAILSKLSYSSQREKKSVRSFKNIIGRSFITKKEAQLLLGVLRAIKRKIEEKDTVN